MLKVKSKILKTIFVLIILVSILALITFLYLEWQIRKPLNNDETRRDFTVSEGQGVKEISRELVSQGFIKHSFYFEVYVWPKKLENKFQAGNFKISSGMNIPEIVRILIGEPEPQEIEITIIEGWDRRDIDAYLADLNLIREGEFLETTQQLEASIYGGYYDASSDASLEGFLFPDTYRVYKDASIDDVLQKMLVNFQNKINPLLPEIERQNRTLTEILTLASMVEKESASSEEMPLISGIFYNRLKANYSLESDATVNFVTGKKLRQPTLEDTKVDSPYNTYLYRGLPPGPICNPGLAAIRAAILPAETQYFYFLHPEEGGAIFSRTLEEHKENKAKYLPR